MRCFFFSRGPLGRGGGADLAGVALLFNEGCIVVFFRGTRLAGGADLAGVALLT